mmetsp:Transcript_14221/g.24302  ORF Transcript_14221/g.24302 Transcript_14221/m.24302 type:complete len:397 (+) Transcript_14221:135-1325(+)|eukprot:CAMPEP_0183726070 /NCGR_PEP_ID=MMETSP0737-20130205/22260_1 /TAXON_ID=385413 /ORGANISM="Thalassiosira miniscula, Strain CCMP1093" /LENGTH=396 /DNA_ID=CAMNT_0025957287 /DNA_START=146 /DNA_END=1336 /DNA_ORIENTATION=-
MKSRHFQSAILAVALVTISSISTIGAAIIAADNFASAIDVERELHGGWNGGWYGPSPSSSSHSSSGKSGKSGGSGSGKSGKSGGKSGGSSSTSNDSGDHHNGHYWGGGGHNWGAPVSWHGSWPAKVLSSSSSGSGKSGKSSGSGSKSSGKSSKVSSSGSNGSDDHNGWYGGWGAPSSWHSDWQAKQDWSSSSSFSSGKSSKSKGQKSGKGSKGSKSSSSSGDGQGGHWVWVGGWTGSPGGWDTDGWSSGISESSSSTTTTSSGKSGKSGSSSSGKSGKSGSSGSSTSSSGSGSEDVDAGGKWNDDGHEPTCDVGATCFKEGSQCREGSETCCGETYDSFVCDCTRESDGSLKYMCFYTDACFFPSCETDDDGWGNDDEDEDSLGGDGWAAPRQDPW